MTFADVCKRHNVAIVTPQLTFDLNQDLYFDIYKMEVENAVRELKVMKLRLTGNKLLKARHGYYDGRGIEWGYVLDLDKDSPTYQKLLPYEPHAAVVRDARRGRARDVPPRTLLPRGAQGPAAHAGPRDHLPTVPAGPAGAVGRAPLP